MCKQIITRLRFSCIRPEAVCSGKRWQRKSSDIAKNHKVLKHHNVSELVDFNPNGWQIWILNYWKRIMCKSFFRFMPYVYAILFLHLWHIVHLIFLLIASWCHFWRIKMASKVNMYILWPVGKYLCFCLWYIHCRCRATHIWTKMICFVEDYSRNIS